MLMPLMSSEKVTIKQMMPIPKEYEIMRSFRQDNGREEMKSVADAMYPYCLTLIEGKGDYDDY